MDFRFMTMFRNEVRQYICKLAKPSYLKAADCVQASI